MLFLGNEEEKSNLTAQNGLLFLLLQTFFPFMDQCFTSCKKSYQKLFREKKIFDKIPGPRIISNIKISSKQKRKINFQRIRIRYKKNLFHSSNHC